MQHSFVRFALRGLGWAIWPLPPYDARCLLVDLESLADRRKVTREDNSYSRKRNARLITFFHRTNYGKFQPLNNAIMNFNYY
jgi:hypothetical protein